MSLIIFTNKYYYFPYERKGLMTMIFWLLTFNGGFDFLEIEMSWSVNDGFDKFTCLSILTSH